MDLTGEWTFKEDFSFGKDEGWALLTQDGSIIKGELEFEESIEDELPFKVKCILEGVIEAGTVLLNVVSFEITESKEPIDYYPETREGIVNVNGQIVGSSIDEEGVCGVFIFERK